MNGRVETIGVIGAGVMGAGIAQVASQVGGYKAILNDVNEGLVAAGMSKIKKNLEDFWLKKGQISQEEMDDILSRIKKTANLEDLKEADLVIECVPENMEIKRNVFAKLDKICPPETILTSNTSGLSITRIASATTRAEKVVGMHFSNPVQRLKRLEIVKGLETSEETVRITMGVGRKMGKDPRLTKRDYPGFSGTRLLSLFINEAFYLVEQGICEPEDVDEGVAKQSFGHSMGPFETADLVGLDTLLNILNYLYKELGEKYRPCPLIEKLVEANYLGRKTGRGVYDYSTGTRKVWMTFN